MRRSTRSHTYTSPWVAGHLLAELVTGLAADLVQLIGGDQITDDAILGCSVPERARAVLRALEDRHEPVLEPREGPVSDPPSAAKHGFRSPVDRAFAAGVGEVLRGRSASIPVGAMTPRVRARFEQLRGDDIVELKRGAYRATYIALYSNFRVDSAPGPRTDKRVGRSTDKRVGRSTDISRDSR